jgi:hypothetical protein
MAQQLRNITIQAPAFAGINTEDSPVDIDQTFAEQANNCVIDKFGRVGSRKGTVKLTTTDPSSLLGSSRGIEAVHEYVKNDGTKTVFSAGNNKIFTGTTQLTEVTLPANYTITANNWKIVTFNNNAYFFQRGHKPLVSVAGSTTLAEVVDGSYDGPQGNEVLAAYGRLWVADVEDNKHTVYWSDLLDGSDFHSGSAGSLNLSKVFPTGNDEIVALSAHNGFLIIFCKNSVIIYQGADTPSSNTADFRIADTIAGVGCVARDSVQNTGTDVIFLAKDGVRSFSRVVQEKSMPMRDISKNVRTDIISLTANQTQPIKSVYSPENAFYLLTFPSNNQIFCFDMRGSLPNGAHRVTTWTDVDPRSLTCFQDGTVCFGKVDGIYKYDEYSDDGSSFRMTYFSNPLNFGDSSRLKFLKKFNITFIGNKTSNSNIKWGYDYTNTYNEQRIEGANLVNAVSAEYGVAEYGTKETTEDSQGNVGDPSFAESEYTSGIDIQRPKVNTTGSGAVVQIGIESVIEGQSFSIQQIDVQALLGRII